MSLLAISRTRWPSSYGNAYRVSEVQSVRLILYVVVYLPHAVLRKNTYRSAHIDLLT